MSTSASATILFDGVCNLCNGFVQFVIRHDPQGRFRFAALQSETGRALLAAHGQRGLAFASASPESVILLEGGQLYSHSAAVLRIARQLRGPWRLAAWGGGLLPLRWRDGLYRFVARHRYRWFGRQDSCMVPTPALRERFI